MRHYVAVQDSNGRWFYANEGRHRETGEHGWSPSGACGVWEGCPDCKDHLPFSAEQKACKTCEGRGLVKKAEPCQGHDTAAEAYEHQRQHRLERHLRFFEDRESANQLSRCKAEGCKAYTSGSAQVGPYSRWPLCAEHRTREAVEPLFCVGESWES